MGRSKTYPSRDLKWARETVVQLVEGFGRQVFSRDDLAVSLGFRHAKIGEASRCISTLRQYGLIQQENDSGFIITSLGFRCAQASTPTEHAEALKTAFLRAPLFKDVTLSCQPRGRLPGNLPVEMVASHGIEPKVCEEVAETYVRSARFAGFLDREGIFCAGQGTSTSLPPAAEPDHEMESEEIPVSRSSTGRFPPDESVSELETGHESKRQEEIRRPSTSYAAISEVEFEVIKNGAATKERENRNVAYSAVLGGIPALLAALIPILESGGLSDLSSLQLASVIFSLAWCFAAISLVVIFSIQARKGKAVPPYEIVQQRIKGDLKNQEIRRDEDNMSSRSSKGPSKANARTKAELRYPLSIAVSLPTANGNSNDVETVKYELARALISALSKINPLYVRVRPFASVSRYSDSGDTPSEIGRKLRVDHVLESSVRQNATRLSVDVSLVDVEGDFVIWSESLIDGKKNDIRGIATRIARGLQRERGIPTSRNAMSSLVRTVKAILGT